MKQTVRVPNTSIKPSTRSWRFCSLAIAVLLALGSTYRCQAQAPLVVQSISALRAVSTSSFTNDTVAYVMDYYGPPPTLMGYRGGGNFRWRTPYSSIVLSGGVASDDGGRFIACNSNTNGLWERILDGGTPNVKMWGAYGDAAHNDTVAIQNALTAAAEWGNGAAVGITEMFFPGGVYLITNTLVFSLNIRGESPGGTTILMQTNVNADIFESVNAYNVLHGGTASFDQHLMFQNIELQFAGTDTNRNKSNSALVICNPGEAHAIRNVHTENGAIGIRCLGSGAPGLRLRDVTVSDAAIAGLSIEPIPGGGGNSGDPISVIGISGDQRYDDSAPTASLILFSNVVAGGSISQIKAEGDFGGGVVQYIYPTNTGLGNMVALSIDNTLYNAGLTDGGHFTPTDLVWLSGPCTPSVTVRDAHLFGVRDLINDQVTGRNVEADIDVFNNLAQQTAQLPLTYGSVGPLAGSQGENSRLVVGQTALSYLYVTNSGWYRVMMPQGVGRLYISGKLTLSLPGFPSTEIEVDMNTANPPWLNVTRAPQGIGQSPVTQARAFYYFDSTMGGDWGFVDIYVGNPLSNPSFPKLTRMAIALDINGSQVPDSGQIELLGQILPVSATLPAGATSTVVNTYR